jgi:hypothetical protein
LCSTRASLLLLRRRRHQLHGRCCFCWQPALQKLLDKLHPTAPQKKTERAPSLSPSSTVDAHLQLERDAAHGAALDALHQVLLVG